MRGGALIVNPPPQFRQLSTQLITKIVLKIYEHI
jgi:hypothetical protein